MRPLVSSSVLYVDLLVSTSTATTTPSSAGMSADTRTSRESPQACVTEATLSTTILRIPLTISSVLGPLARTPREHACQRDNLGKAQSIRRSPLTDCFAVNALGGRHQ